MWINDLIAQARRFDSLPVSFCWVIKQC